MELALQQISSHLGIEVLGMNLTEEIGSKMLGMLFDQLYYHHLLIIREQHLTEEQLIRVGSYFGEPIPALVPTHRLEKYPVISKHANRQDENQLPIGAIAPEYVFHSDSYFTSNPNKETLFYSLKSPINGGDTYFVNMCHAYDTLENAMKLVIANKKVRYKNAYINQPPVQYPLVRTHSVTKRKALFVNIHRALGIEDMDDHEALELIGYLYNHAIKPEFIYKHKWHDGDLLIWNNPTTMHCATSTPDVEERLLYRILIQGELPLI